jgi:tRNA threonylcarbamoyladenosine biosynthesis protein TsaE
MLIKHITGNYKKTQKLGEIFAEKIIKNELQNPPAGVAMIIGLHGDLGSGKTTFIQGFAKRLGIDDKILSPTFVIMKKFRIQNSEFKIQKFKNFYHIDCYRLKNEKDILELGLKEIILNPENIVAIEWPEKIYPVEFAEGDVLQKAKRFNRGKRSLPPPNFIIKFKFIDKNKREIILDEII